MTRIPSRLSRLWEYVHRGWTKNSPITRGALFGLTGMMYITTMISDNCVLNTANGRLITACGRLRAPKWADPSPHKRPIARVSYPPVLPPAPTLSLASLAFPGSRQHGWTCADKEAEPCNDATAPLRSHREGKLPSPLMSTSRRDICSLAFFPELVPV